MNNIAVCLSSDNNYVQHLAAVISSILNNKDNEDFINIYILDGGIDENNKTKLLSFEKKYDCKITFLKPDLNKLSNCSTYNSNYITLATYNRLLIPEIIQNEDRVIYLDCDIIVRKSLNKLFNSDFNNNLILGALDVGNISGSKRLDLPLYINTGVLLFNSKQMREENTTAAFFNFIQNDKNTIQNHDQDIINCVCKNRIGIIENTYNAQVIYNDCSDFEKIKDPTILHFISPKKPWVIYKPLCYTHWEKEYFKALKNTPWENFIDDYNKKKKLYFLANLFYPTGKIKNILRSIFSVKNTPDRKYKIITILGIEIQKKYKISDKKKLNILVCYHKKDKIFKNKFLTPIQLGKSIQKTKSKDGTLASDELDWLNKNMIGDDTGENISSKNRFLNEMTGIYWAWKNYKELDEPDFIGINHYRRYFKLNYSNLDKILKKYDLIFLKKPSFKEGIYEQWKTSSSYSDFDFNGMDLLIETYKKLHPEDFENFTNYINNPNHGGFMNIFIMKKEDFFNYCNWIFGIIEDLENKIHKNNRTIAMLTERLTSYYLDKLEKSGKKVLKTSVVDEPPRFEFSYFVSRIFNLKHTKQTNGKNHLQLILFGLKFNIKTKGEDYGN